MFYLENNRNSLFQWDTNQKLLVNDNSIKAVHYNNGMYKEAFVVEVINGAAAIPNILLQSSWNIKAYAYTGNYTKVEKVFEVVERSKPADYIYEETEVVTFGRLKEIYDNIQADEAEIADAAAQSSKNLNDLINMMGNDVATLVAGKVPMSQIPATATQEIYTIGNESELTSLTAQRGDLAELIQEVNGEKTITKTWQCLGDAAKRENWIIWGTSYAVQAGNATTANDAADSKRINGMRFVTMKYTDFVNAIKNPDTIYAVDMEG